MAKLIPNSFSTFELTEEELLQGTLLTITQKQVIHNSMANFAEQLVEFNLDANDLTSSLQSQAYLRGQRDALNWLLEASAAVEVAQREAATNPLTS